VRARAAWAALICVIVLGAVAADFRAEIINAEARVAGFSENIVVVDRPDHEKFAGEFSLWGRLLYERRARRHNREGFLSALAEDSGHLGDILVSNDKISGRISKRGWQHCPKRNVVVGGNNSTEYHAACWCLTGISDANCDCGHPLIPAQVGGFDVDICPQLALGSFIGEFDGGLCRIGRILSSIGRFFGFQQRIVESAIGFPEHPGVDYGGDEQKERPSHQPSGESINWRSLVKPPALTFIGLALGLICGLAGFVILFGPHTRPTDYALKNVGAGLLLVGLLLSALAAFIVVAAI
jgi:hypothetical protein